MATLDDLQDVLKSIDRTMIDQKSLLTDMISAQATRDRLSSVNNSTTNPANAGAAPSFGQSFGAAAGSAAGNGIGAGAGLIGMGAGIAGFMAALSVGSMGLDWLGADYSGLGDAFASFSEAITNLSPAAAIALTGIAVIASKLTIGSKAMIGMTSIGLGIAGFMSALALGDKGIEWIGAIPEGSGKGLVSAFKMFNDSIMALSEESMIALSALLVAAPRGTAMSVGLPLLGLGIVGFMGALTLGDKGISWINAIPDGSSKGLVSAFKMFNDSIMALSEESMIALSALLVAANAGPGLLSMSVGAPLLAAAIVGFMGVLTLGDEGIKWLSAIPDGSSNGLVSGFKMFNDSIMALSEESMIAFTALLVAANLGPGLLSMSVGAPLLGLAIVGFMGALVLGDEGIKWLSAIPDGSSGGLVSAFKLFNDSVLAITPEAIERLKDLTALGGFDIAGAITGLSAGVVAMFATEGIKSIGGMITDGFKNTVDFIFGTNYADQKNPSIFQGLVDGLEPIKGFDVTPINTFIETLDLLTAAFERLSNLDSSKATSGLANMMADFGGVLDVLPYLLNGGTYKGATSNWLSRALGTGRGEISFGPEGGGLKNLAEGDLEALSNGINALRNVLGVSSQTSSVAPAVQAATTESSLANNTSQIGILTTNTDKMIELSQNILKSLEVIAAGSPSSAQQAAASVISGSGNTTDARSTATSINITNNQNQRNYSELKYGTGGLVF